MYFCHVVKYILVERNEFEERRSGQSLKHNPKAPKDIFNYPYDLPEGYPNQPTEKKEYVMLSTVKSFSCEPKQVCNRCEGTSVCSDCEATGKEYCGKCNGKGKIEKTDYHNNKPRQVVKSCNQCKGTGYISCKTCRGNGKCQKCKGLVRLPV